MAITTKEEQYKRLRSYLNPAWKGPVTDAILEALAENAAAYLINNINAVNDQLYVATASGRYLDELLSSITARPPNVGLSDDIYREIGIEVKNRKQVRDLINNILNSIFGDELVRATSQARAYEPYNLMDGDTLILNFDDGQTVQITFKANQFQSIGAATAQEIADVITKSLRGMGTTGTSIARDDGNGPYVQLISDTIGVASSVTVLGGRAQNELKFDSSVPAGGNMSTQWTILLQPSGTTRFTWSGGANPQIGRLKPGNYVNIFGGGFTSSSNEGTYNIVKVQGGSVGSAYFEIDNPNGSSGIVNQGTDDAILFYNPVRKVVSDKTSYAAVYQTDRNILNIFIPAATKVIRRDRIGSAHLHDPPNPESYEPDQPGPYLYDTAQPFVISHIGTTLTQNLDGTMPRVFGVSDSSQFPDQSGYLILGYGTSNQEGPIPYIARPSDSTLLISPAYTVQNKHATGTDVALVASKSSVDLSKDGTDYPFYITDVVSGRLYAQDLINTVAATGITVIFNILYPSDIGLGKWSTEYSENPEIWGS